MNTLRLSLLLVLAGLFVGGCPSCAPDLVGQGVARLTVRNVGAVTSLVTNDEDCGFASDKVDVKVDGEVGGEGTLTLTVKDCAIDAGSGQDVSTDCEDVKTIAKGKVTVSATRTINGTLTGNADPALAIVPNGPDAVTIKLTKVEFDGFSVEKTDSDDVLTNTDGSLTATVKPRLAVDETTGVCSIATPNVTFTIKYGASNVHVKTPDNEFDADVASSDYTAQSGKKGKSENSISGKMTVFGSEIDVKDDGKLDPSYKKEDFLKSYACTENLQDPENFTCGDLNAPLADGAARLTTKTLGTLASLLNADDACGFASAGVLGAAVPDGDVGGDGTITFTVTDCELAFGATPVALPSDCNGVATEVSGTVTVSATKVITGRFTGDFAGDPVVPDSDRPAVVTITSAEFADFTLGSSADNNSIRFENGTLAGTVTPRTALSSANGACSISSANAALSVTSLISDVAVTSDSGTFNLAITAADFDATNGSMGDGTNELAGTVTVDETAYTVPSDGLGLNPTFNQAEFDDSWQCAPDLVTPVSHQCTFVVPIAIGASQLSMRTFGTVVSIIDANTACGFSSPAVGGGVTFEGPGGVGDDGQTAVFTIGTACEVTLPADTPLSLDCNGVTTTGGGTISVTGTKRVTGFQTGDPFEPVVPTSSTPAVFDLTITFTEFVVENSASTASLTIHSGQLAGTMSPRVILDPLTGACSVSTPNVAFSNVTWTDADVTLLSDGKTFDMQIATSDLDAQNGTTGAASNSISGTITVDGAPVPVGGPLDPAFDQTTFDAGYTCDPDGAGPEVAPIVPPVEAACSFRTALGFGAAALLTKSMGVSANVVKADNTCGFSTPAVFGAGETTGTAPGVGSFEMTITDCDKPLGGTDIPLGAASCPLDGNGTTLQTLGHGAINGVDGTLLQTGFLTGAAPPNPNIIPLERTGVTIDVTEMTLVGLHLADSVGGGPYETESTVDGVFATTVVPVLGQSDQATAALAGAPGSPPGYGVSTTVAHITTQSAAATITIVSEGKTFNLSLTDVNLDAFAGSWDGTGAAAGVARENEVTGALTIDGIPVTLGTGTPLDPDFNNALSTAVYACNPDLTAPIPAAP
jgi:hypothetical protein